MAKTGKPLYVIMRVDTDGFRQVYSTVYESDKATLRDYVLAWNRTRKPDVAAYYIVTLGATETVIG